jgi:hypothetical protein
LGFDFLTLVTDALEYLGGQFGSGAGAQTNKVWGFSSHTISIVVL